MLIPLEPGETFNFQIPESEVYACDEVLAGGNTVEWTLIRLDRPVTNRQPLKLQRFGYPLVGETVHNAGYPERLPLKTESAVLTSSDKNGGNADAHVLPGSSGSSR